MEKHTGPGPPRRDLGYPRPKPECPGLEIQTWAVVVVSGCEQVHLGRVAPLKKEVEHLLVKRPLCLDHQTVTRQLVGNHIQATWNMLHLQCDVPVVAP